jgi:hypothetical protein
MAPSWKERLAEQRPADDDGAAEPIPVVAAAPAALIETGRPIAPQLLPRVRQSHTRLIELETEISWLSLDALLDVKSPAADQRRRLVRELHEAKAEHDRLVDGYRVSLDRDEQSAAAIEIAELERQLAEYEGYAAARVAAMQDFNVATRAVE